MLHQLMVVHIRQMQVLEAVGSWVQGILLFSIISQTA